MTQAGAGPTVIRLSDEIESSLNLTSDEAIANLKEQYGEQADVSALEAARERTLAAVYSRGAEGEAGLQQG